MLLLMRAADMGMPCFNSEEHSAFGMNYVRHSKSQTGSWNQDQKWGFLVPWSNCAVLSCTLCGIVTGNLQEGFLKQLSWALMDPLEGREVTDIGPGWMWPRICTSPSSLLDPTVSVHILEPALGTSVTGDLGQRFQAGLLPYLKNAWHQHWWGQGLRCPLASIFFAQNHQS